MLLLLVLLGWGMIYLSPENSLVTTQKITYNFWSVINDPVFFGFWRKLTRTKTQQCTDKSSGHDGGTVF